MSIAPETCSSTAIGRRLLLATVPFWRAPPAFAAIIAFVLIGNHMRLRAGGAMSVRSFFGVAKISESPDGEFRILQHGTTMHGAQRIRDADGEPVIGPTEPLLYYYDGSAIAQAIDAAQGAPAAPIRYRRDRTRHRLARLPGRARRRVHYYEIDPAIIRIARDPELFTFLLRVPARRADHRSATRGSPWPRRPTGAYDLIIVDAFTSDAIPIHLLTREAMAIYREKLSAATAWWCCTSRTGTSSLPRWSPASPRPTASSRA